MSATDDSLYETMIRAENKDIFIDLKKNSFGIYLKISERNGQGRTTVLIPASGIPRLKTVLEEVAQASLKAKGSSPEKRIRATGNPDVVARSVYVSGLSWDTTDEELANYFNQAGNVTKATILRQRRRDSARSSMGCGVVEFDTEQTAQVAITLLNDTELKGRQIRCREDRAGADTTEFSPLAEMAAAAAAASAPPSTRSSRARKASSGDDDDDDEEPVPEPNKIFVTNLTWDTSEDDLILFFSNVGIVASAEVNMTKKGRSKGSGIVEFTDSSATALAIEQLNNALLKGREIGVREYYR